MLDRFIGRAAALLIGCLVLITGCALPTETCGTRRGEHGPQVIETREQEMCEITRRRVFLFLRTAAGITNDHLEDWRAGARRWKRVRTSEDLVRGVRQVVGDELADSIAQGIAQVRAKSQKPSHASGDPEIALLRAAAHGIELALEAVEVDDDARDLINAVNAELPDHLTD